MVKKNNRMVSIELLRLILMFMVVMLHVLGHSILNYPMSKGISQYNAYTASLMESLCIVAVDCFILISGYFSVKFSFFKILKLLLLMWQYRLGIYIIFVLLGLESFSIHELIKYAIPLQWWFMQYYLFLIIASPLLNWIIKNLTKRNYRILLLVMFILFSILPTVSRFSFTNDRGQGCINFIFMYFLGAYLKRYPPAKIRIQWLILIYLFNCFVMIAGNLLLYGSLINDFGWSGRLWGYDTIFVQINAVLLLLIFLNINMSRTRGRIVKRCAQATLAIYIIHEHVLIRDFLFNNLFHLEFYYNNNTFIIIAIGAGIGIYFSCLIIELIRSTFLNRIENLLIDRILKARLTVKIINKSKNFLGK